MKGRVAEIIFVDDSDDSTPDVIAREAARSGMRIRLMHRDDPVGGLSGAVVAGMLASTAEWIVVMDGDLQHPPEMLPILLDAGADEEADVVVASRHINGGSNAGLDGAIRQMASGAAKMLTRAMFPFKLRHCTDPMTGFFAVRRDAVDVRTLRPQGFKILLEILARTSLKVVEEPFVFAERRAGVSKATFGQGLKFLSQLAALRFGRLSGFALVGAVGAVVNILIMAMLQAMGVWYLTAAVLGAIVTIIGNFILQERFVFPDLLPDGRRLWGRLWRSLAFNGSETLVRTSLLWVVVESTPVPSLLAQALLIAIGFVLRFVFHSRVVYRQPAAVRRELRTMDDIESAGGQGTATIPDERLS
jgi:dolichol-phosphate mannosyltransferase